MLKDANSSTSQLYQKLIEEKVMNLGKTNDYSETGLSSLGNSLGQHIKMGEVQGK